MVQRARPRPRAGRVFWNKLKAILQCDIIPICACVLCVPSAPSLPSLLPSAPLEYSRLRTHKSCAQKSKCRTNARLSDSLVSRISLLCHMCARSSSRPPVWRPTRTCDDRPQRTTVHGTRVTECEMTETVHILLYVAGLTKKGG